MNEAHALTKAVVVTTTGQSEDGVSKSIGTLTSHQLPEGQETLSASEGTKKLLKVTTGIRLANRSTGNWHHCGLND